MRDNGREGPTGALYRMNNHAVAHRASQLAVGFGERLVSIQTMNHLHLMTIMDQGLCQLLNEDSITTEIPRGIKRCQMQKPQLKPRLSPIR